MVIYGTTYEELEKIQTEVIGKLRKIRTYQEWSDYSEINQR